jgi:hypothetical protein
MTTHRFVTLEREKKLILLSGRYDTSPSWHDPSVQSKSSYQKILKVQEWKISTWIKIKNFFSLIGSKKFKTHMPIINLTRSATVSQYILPLSLLWHVMVWPVDQQGRVWDVGCCISLKWEGRPLLQTPDSGNFNVHCGWLWYLFSIRTIWRC